MAVLADVGVSLLVIANGLRLRRWAPSRNRSVTDPQPDEPGAQATTFRSD
jgi:hypothetical protein